MNAMAIVLLAFGALPIILTPVMQWDINRNRNRNRKGL